MDCNLIIRKARGRVSGMLSSFRDAENVCDSAPLSARIPFPHTEHDFLRKGIPQLAGKHGNLSAMVSVMGDEISKKADRVWTKAFDVAVGRDGSAQDYAESFAALFHCPQSLRRGDLGTIELIEYLAALGRRRKPHDTYIVHMGHDRLNGTAFAPRRACLPSLRKEDGRLDSD